MLESITLHSVDYIVYTIGQASNINRQRL